MAGECYFRFTVVAILGAVIGLFAFLIVFFYCLSSLRRNSRNQDRVSIKEGDSILGDEFRRTPTLINDVTQIGRQSDLDKDLSLVADSYDAIAQVNSPNDSIREDLFNAAPYKHASELDYSSNQNQIHLGRNKKK